MQTKLLETTIAAFDVIVQRRSDFVYPSDTREKWEYNVTVHQLFIDFKEAYDFVRREALYNILIVIGMPRKLVGLNKVCLNETYSIVRIDKNLSECLALTMA
jgi:hypothetical protein